MTRKVKAKTVLLIIVSLVAIVLLNNLVFTKNHNIVVQHYDVAKNEYVFYKNATKEKDIRNIHRIIQNADWEKYYPAKDDNVLCQFYFDNGNDKAILYQVINNYGGFILVQKDVDQKSSLVNKDLGLLKTILQ
jgi:hypothetical protein